MQINDLHKLRRMKEHISSYERRIQELTSAIEKTTSDTTLEPVQGGTSDKQNLITKLIELKDEYYIKMLELYQKRRQAEEQIEQMDTLNIPSDIEQQKLFLTLRYIECLTMERIAVELNISFRWVFIIRKQAEKNFNELHHN